MSKAYIARYPLNEEGNDLNEIILFQDTYWSKYLDDNWNSLIEKRGASEPMLQGWYSNSNQAVLMASTNQPFKLD